MKERDYKICLHFKRLLKEIRYQHINKIVTNHSNESNYYYVKN